MAKSTSIPISPDRWITDIDITFAIPTPPTRSADLPLRKEYFAVWYLQLLELQAGQKDATTTPSDPPRLMATGKASEVESTVPSNARAYRVVGFVLCRNLPQQKI